MRVLNPLLFASILALATGALSTGCSADEAADGDGTTSADAGDTTGGQTQGDATGADTATDGDATTDTTDGDATTDTTDGDATTDTTDGDDTTDTSGSDDTTDGDTTDGGETTDTSGTGDDTTSTGDDTGADTGDVGGLDDGIPKSELLVKILGPPLADTGKSHVAVQGSVTPITGVVFGSPDTIVWETESGESGEAGGEPFFQTTGIPLEQGSNLITITATKGDQVVTDTITITYNPSFLFDTVPRVSPNLLFAGETSKAVINIPITLYNTFIPSSVAVWQVDEKGAPISASSLAKLNDNGVLSQCDEIEEDGVFSACISSISCSGDDIFLSVSADIDSETAQYTAWTAPTRIECATRILASSCSAAQTSLQSARGEYESAGGESDPIAGRDAAIAYLQGQSGVTAAGPASGDGFGVWVEFDDGFLGALNLSPEGMRGGGAPAAAAAQALSSMAGTQPGGLNTKAIASKKALVLSPYSSEFNSGAGDEAAEINGLLTNSGCPTFTVEGVLSNADAHLNVLRSQYLYGIVAMSTHGDTYFQGMDVATKEAMGWDHKGSQEVLWSGEAAVCSNLTTSNKTCSSNSDCNNGTSCVITGAVGTTLSGSCVDKTQMDLRKGRVILSDDRWGFTGGFVSRHAERRFPNSLVYLGACRSLHAGTFAAEYMAAGAKAVAGFGDYVTSEFAVAQGKTFFEKMLLENELTGGGYFAATAEDPNNTGSWFRLFGAKNLNIMDANLINPSFETADLTGWTAVGDGRVISKLGISIPVHGKFMSVISTGLGFTVQTGEISQDFCIPGDKNTMGFYWKFFSEEFKEWCGSQFQDTFEATIANDVGQITLTSTKVDDLCHYNDGSCSSCPDPGVGNCECGGQYKGLIASDVSFDQGGVWNIQWQQTEKDITPLAGQGPVTLKFFSTDAGDSIYDTVILIDSITFK
ncbi:MAG: hypothetical protein ACI9WU_001531 [Myxococcota bacterium]|jgi:hypothetical protein